MKVTLVIILTLSALGIVNFVNKFFSLPDDNPAEEFVERVIEDQLDLPKDSIDLTPDYDGVNKTLKN